LEVLMSVATQTVLPSLVIVIDNNPDGAAEATVSAFAARSSLPIDYLRMAENSGPAGAFAAALTALAQHPSKPEWMACRDDDGPFPDSDVIASLMDVYQRTTGQPAAIGTFGKNYGTQAKASDAPNGLQDVDFIPGGGFPAYHIPTLASHGINFNPTLFFGFEELELGLQIKRRGLRLLADRLVASNYNTAPRRRSTWRTYFQFRNRLLVARDFGTIRSVPLHVASCLYQSARRLLDDRSPADAIAVIAGVLDGLRSPQAPRRRYIPT
jgi:GT2 family glycosyltransferase